VRVVIFFYVRNHHAVTVANNVAGNSNSMLMPSERNPRRYCAFAFGDGFGKKSVSFEA